MGSKSKKEEAAKKELTFRALSDMPRAPLKKVDIDLLINPTYIDMAHHDIYDTLFNIKCLKCSSSFSLAPSDMKLNEFGQLMVFCPKCYNPGLEHIGNRTLSQLKKIFRR